MAKSKSRKPRRTRQQPVTEKQPEQTKPAAPAPASTPAISTSQRSDVDFGREYHYVYTDLRSIFIIAAIMFVGMISLLYVL